MKSYPIKSQLPCSEGQHVLDEALESTVDAEGQSHVSNDPCQPRLGARVEAHETVLHHDLLATVNEAFVLCRMLALQPRLDDIDRIIGHDGAEAGETTGNKVASALGFDVL